MIRQQQLYTSKRVVIDSKHINKTVSPKIVSAILITKQYDHDNNPVKVNPTESINKIHLNI